MGQQIPRENGCLDTSPPNLSKISVQDGIRDGLSTKVEESDCNDTKYSFSELVKKVLVGGWVDLCENNIHRELKLMLIGFPLAFPQLATADKNKFALLQGNGVPRYP